MNMFKAFKLKSWVFAALVLATTMLACDSKDDAKPDQSKVEGKWKLESISGGFAGNGYTADWNYLEMNANKTYRRLQNDTLRYQGTYELQEKDGKTYIDFKVGATPSNSPFEDQDKEVVFEKDKLILSDPCCDLYQYEFSKAKN
ncbi:MAG: hypothetical protein IPO07_10610 [Haliscomenobacter sp.]|nr:hypothetical protein [Haliscomenobacter sp.]MBK9489190.1 hypothetical protein [Haliscomenobacter sp.]